MSHLRSLTLLVAIGLVAALGKDLSKYRQDGYFGKQEVKDGQIPADNTTIRPFKIDIPQSELDYLKKRLANARFIDHLPDTQFHYGMSSDELKKIVNYWNTTYDWRQQEQMLNSYPNFKTQIEGIDIHFVHVKASPKATRVIPLMTLHGWPSSFYEAYGAMESYIEPDEDGLAFEVIAPSIPGYGYSEAAHLKGMDNAAAARIFNKLMNRLGHQKYFLQGGDWGGIITRSQAILYPENVIGIHVLGLFDPLENLLDIKRLLRNIATPHIPSLNPAQWKKDYEKLFPLKQTLVNGFDESAILHYQMTKPDTLADALQDTPVGLAAHLLDKYCTFVNTAYMDREDGGLTQKFTMDQLLNVVMIYWTSGNQAGNTRLYKEFVQSGNGINNEVIKVPAGVVDAPHEAIRSPKALVEANYADLRQFTDLPAGGHLMNFEEPKLVEEDLRKLVKKIVPKEQSAFKQWLSDPLKPIKDIVKDPLKPAKDAKDAVDGVRDKVKETADKLNPFNRLG